MSETTNSLRKEDVNWDNYTYILRNPYSIKARILPPLYFAALGCLGLVFGLKEQNVILGLAGLSLIFFSAKSFVDLAKQYKHKAFHVPRAAIGEKGFLLQAENSYKAYNWTDVLEVSAKDLSFRKKKFHYIKCVIRDSNTIELSAYTESTQKDFVSEANKFLSHAQ